MPVPTLELTAIQVFGLACLGLVLGEGMKRAVPALARLSIPSSILGGLAYAATAFMLRDRVVNLKFDTALRELLMIGFFTTVGMGASLRLLKLGGRRVGVFLAAAVVGLLAQTAWGVGAARAMGLPALFGVIPGAVSLTGGPATALAFGPVFEQAGVAGATAVGLSSAVFGIVVSGLIGGFVGSYLIRKHRLAPTLADGLEAPRLHEGATQAGYQTQIFAIGISMALGSLLSTGFKSWGLTLPAYIGAMIVAGALRNLDDRFGFVGIASGKIEAIGEVALELFIVMALLTLELWHLSELALPVLVILVGQVVITVVLCWTVIYVLMGRNYTSAVMAGGYCGFMLGTTANAMACMSEITRRTGPAPQAFFAVGIVGAFLIDFINALLITQTLNLF